MQILQFKSQLTYAFYAAVNHLSRPLRKQKFTSAGSKGHGLWFVIGGFQSVLYVSVFQVRFVPCDWNYDWQQGKTHLWRQLLNLRVCMFLKSAVIILLLLLIASLDKVKNLREHLQACKSLLHCKREELKKYWMDGLEYNEVLNLLDRM